MKSIEHKEGKIKWKVFKKFSFKVMRLTLNKVADNHWMTILALLGIYIYYVCTIDNIKRQMTPCAWKECNNLRKNVPLTNKDNRTSVIFHNGLAKFIPCYFDLCSFKSTNGEHVYTSKSFVINKKISWCNYSLLDCVVFILVVVHKVGQWQQPSPTARRAFDVTFARVPRLLDLRLLEWEQATS